jgi:hypothetical protein
MKDSSMTVPQGSVLDLPYRAPDFLFTRRRQEWVPRYLSQIQGKRILFGRGVPCRLGLERIHFVVPFQEA